MTAAGHGWLGSTVTITGILLDAGSAAKAPRKRSLQRSADLSQPSQLALRRPRANRSLQLINGPNQPAKRQFLRGDFDS
jgi:hypothetical protein